MRKITEQGVIILDGQVNTPQDWLPCSHGPRPGPALLFGCLPPAHSRSYWVHDR
jgi:hypothetical protein